MFQNRNDSNIVKIGTLLVQIFPLVERDPCVILESPPYCESVGMVSFRETFRSDWNDLSKSVLRKVTLGDNINARDLRE